MKVLVIEDNPEICNSIEVTLTLRWPEADFKFSTFGKKGVEFAETYKPDIIILDLGLPDIDGYEVLRHVRSFSYVPVLILTARIGKEEIAKALENGADDFLSKPFHNRELLARIQVLVRRYESYQDVLTINRSSAILNSNFDIKSNYSEFIRELTGVVNIDWSAIVSVENQDANFWAIFSKNNPIWYAGEKIPITSSEVEQLLISKNKVVEPYLSIQNKFYLGKVLASNGLHSAIFLPIRSRNEIIACFVVASERDNAYSPREISFLEEMTTYISSRIEQVRLFAQTEQTSRTDPLTKLLNRGSFNSHLVEEINRCSRNGEIFSLLMLDLDSFKTVNDNLGHPAGDELLIKTAQIITNRVRESDFVFRFGGDEFALILPKTSSKGALEIASWVHDEIQLRASTADQTTTCSIGIATFPENGSTSEEITQMADSALYLAKRLGKNRVCSASNIPSDVTSKGNVEVKKSRDFEECGSSVSMMNEENRYVLEHSNRVSEYVVSIATELGYSAERIEIIRNAAILHDVGKMGIEEGILYKKSVLTEKEWGKILKHPEMGVDILGQKQTKILSQIKNPDACFPGILYHHERYDGKGYPQGLKGEEIPLDARIIAVADSYDAMTSLRPYRDCKMTIAQAMEELQANAGTQFDPFIVEVFTTKIRNH